MEWLVSLCVRRRGVVAALAAILLAVGIWDARDTPLDVFPDFVPPQVSIQTEAPGFTPSQVEQLVTRRIEAAVNGAPALDRMQSESIPGLSVVTMFFSDGTDPNRAHQDIAERLQRVAGDLPQGVHAPQLSPLVSSTMDLLKIGLVSDKLSPYEMRDLADWTLKPLILGVPGVARVNVFGGEVRQIHVIPKLDVLSAYGLTLTELGDAVRSATALRGGGFIDFKAQRILIESPVPKPDPKTIGDAVVTVRNNVPIKVSDLATVKVGPALKSGNSVIMGKPGILLTISSQYGANTMDTTRRLETALHQIFPRLEAEGITVYPAMHRPANFIERALSDLRDALAVAAILIILILLAFLRDLRSAFISFITIPLSLLAAVVVMKHLGHTLNMMTIGGLAVAIGVLVDDAIIDIENIMRRLSLNAASPEPLPPTRSRTTRLTGDSVARPVCDPCGYCRLCPGLPDVRNSRPVHRPVGALFHARGRCLADRRSDGNPGAVRAAAVETRHPCGFPLDCRIEAISDGGDQRDRGKAGAGGPGSGRRLYRSIGLVALARRTIHAGLPRGSFRRSDLQRGSGNLIRRDDGARRTDQQRIARAAIR